MAENLKNFFMEYNISKYKEDINGDAVIEEKIKENCTNIPFPEEVLEKDKPIGIYFNPEEGCEVFEGFLDLINAFKKKGLDLEEKDKDSIYRFIIMEDVSPGFVNKMVNDYGYESVIPKYQATFGCNIIPLECTQSDLDMATGVFSDAREGRLVQGHKQLPRICRDAAGKVKLRTYDAAQLVAAARMRTEIGRLRVFLAQCAFCDAVHLCGSRLVDFAVAVLTGASCDLPQPSISYFAECSRPP